MSTGTNGITVRTADPYLVAPHVVSGFAEAVGETDPLCHDARAAAAAGFPGVVAAPGFAFVVAYRLGTAVIAAAGLGLENVLHVRESHRIVRPMTAGDELDAMATVAGPRAMSGGLRMLSWDSTVIDASGAVIASTSTTVLMRPDGRWPEPRPGAPGSRPEPPAPSPTTQRQVTRGQVATYCGVSGDAHPVHWSDFEARRHGLPGLIMHGSLLFAIAAGAAARACGGITRVAEMSARLVAPVHVPDDGRGAVLDIATNPPDASGAVLLSVWADGRPVLGSARAKTAMRQNPPAAQHGSAAP
jgi:acyl dehydratase